jgi:hypothetical protein
MRLLAVAALLALTTVGGVSGCSNPNNNTVPPATSEPVVGTTAAPETQPAPKPAFDPSAGPIIGSFTEGHLDTLKQVDPATGETTEVFKAAAVQDAAPTFDPVVAPTHLTGWILQQIFDSKLERMAVNWDDKSDGSKHVGWIDKDGSLTDVTAQIAGGGSDFAARPQDAYALFDEKGQFAYVDLGTGMLVRVDPVTLKKVGKPVKVANDYGNVVKPAFFQPDGSVDDYQSDRLYDSGMVLLIKMPAGPVITSVAPEAAVQDIIDGERVLVSTGKALKVMSPANFKKRVGDADADTGSSVPAITPATDYQVEVATISSDKKTIAFSAVRGEDRALFIMKLGSSAPPSKIMSLAPSDRLLFWR